jgi:hypothetical protein
MLLIISIFKSAPKLWFVTISLDWKPKISFDFLWIDKKFDWNFYCTFIYCIFSFCFIYIFFAICC